MIASRFGVWGLVFRTLASAFFAASAMTYITGLMILPHGGRGWPVIPVICLLAMAGSALHTAWLVRGVDLHAMFTVARVPLAALWAIAGFYLGSATASGHPIYWVLTCWLSVGSLYFASAAWTIDRTERGGA
jgi:hypothetical protein